MYTPPTEPSPTALYATESTVGLTLSGERTAERGQDPVMALTLVALRRFRISCRARIFEIVLPFGFDGLRRLPHRQPPCATAQKCMARVIRQSAWRMARVKANPTRDERSRLGRSARNAGSAGEALEPALRTQAPTMGLDWLRAWQCTRLQKEKLRLPPYLLTV